MLNEISKGPGQMKKKKESSPELVNRRPEFPLRQDTEGIEIQSPQCGLSEAQNGWRGCSVAKNVGRSSYIRYHFLD